jgi:hypothetical protein
MDNTIAKSPINMNIDSLNYDDDEQYRIAMCQIFFIEMDPNNLETCNFESMNAGLDYVWLHTSSNESIVELYVLAAAALLTEDTMTGLLIMFSFDYLKDFYILLREHFENPGKIDKNHPLYIVLRNKLEKK